MALDERKHDRQLPSQGLGKAQHRRAVPLGRKVFAVGVAGVLAAPLALTLCSGGCARGRVFVEREPQRSPAVRVRRQQRVRQRFRPGHGGERLLLHRDVEHLPVDDRPRATPGSAGGVAQSWTVSNNGSTVTFHIRPGLEFLQRSARDVDGRGGQPEQHEDQPAPLARSSPSRASRRPTPRPWWSTSTKPTAGDFLWAMTLHGRPDLPGRMPSQRSRASPIGAGPFMLKSYRQGASIDLVKNPKYWDSKAYPLGGVDFTQVTQGPEAATRPHLGIGGHDRGRARRTTRSSRATPTSASPSRSRTTTWRSRLRQNTGPFANEKVRAALEFAVDRAALNKVVFDGLGAPAYQPVPTWSPGYSKSLGTPDPYNPAKAKAMLKAAGYPKGVRFTLIIPAGDATYAAGGRPPAERDGGGRVQRQPAADSRGRLPRGRLHQEAG